jgi:hypothetical protein
VQIKIGGQGLGSGMSDLENGLNGVFEHNLITSPPISTVPPVLS